VTSREETCWMLIRNAAGGDRAARSLFAHTYLPVVRAYLAARWQTKLERNDIDDAVQDTFIDCFRAALGRADPGKPGRFRTFLYAVVRNVARRYEERRALNRVRVAPNEAVARGHPAGEERLSHAFDRAWTRELLRRAAARQRARAREGDEAARMRVELLRLRFAENLPIREIARLRGEDAARVHHEYARARREFKQALLEEVAVHHPGTPGAIERECAALLSLVG